MNSFIEKTAQYIFDRDARLLTIGLAVLLALPGLGTFFSDGTARSISENRTLAGFPELFAADRETSLFAELDTYLNDHFGFALFLNQLHKRIVFHVFGDSPSSSFKVGQDAFIFLVSHPGAPRFSVLNTLCLQSQQPKLTADAVSDWMRILDHYTAKGMRTALVLIPPKPVVYPEKLPVSVPQRYHEACRQYSPSTSLAGAVANLDTGLGPGIGGASERAVVYPFEEFRSARDDGNFYPKETFHFAGKSAHLTAGKTLIRLGINPSPDFDEYVVTRDFAKDYDELLGFPQSIESEVYHGAAFQLSILPEEPALISRFMAKSKTYGTIRSAAPLSRRKALLVGDSFTTVFADALAPGYRELVWIVINHLDEEEGAKFFGEMFDEIRPDDLIFVFHDTGLVNNTWRRWPVKFLAAD